MQQLQQAVEQVLRDDPSLVAEGRINKNLVVEKALHMDAGLLSLLLQHELTKRHFFAEVNGILVFDKTAFQRFVSNKAFLPDSYTAFKNKIGLTAEGAYLSRSKEVVLDWPYKDCVLEGGQSRAEQGRKEIFWNKTLAADEIDRLLTPKVLCGFTRYDRHGAHELSDLSDQDSFLIRGNNLLALHSLRQRYREQVRLIYIDPPYNTGNDSFLYNDSFGEAAWLTFMKNRLEVARELLHPEGAIFIQIDDKEMAYLKVLCDEVFGRENFRECITIKNGSESGVNAINVMRGERLFKVKEHILYYARQHSAHRFRPLYVKSMSYNDSYRLQLSKSGSGYTVTDVYKKLLREKFGQDSLRGLDQAQKNSFFYTFEQYCLAHGDSIYALKTDIQKSGGTFKQFARENKLKGGVDTFRTSDGRDILVYKGGMLTPLRDRLVEENGKKYYGTLVSDFWWDIGATPSAEGKVVLKAGKKPEKLLKRIISLCTEENDLVMDFFLGSGTTAATAMKMRRRFIGIEQLNYGANDSLVRLQHVIAGDNSGISKDSDVRWQGGGSFVSVELKKLNQSLIDELARLKKDDELYDHLIKVMDQGLIDYRLRQEAPDLPDGFRALSFADKKRFLREVLDHNFLYLPFSEIEDEEYGVDERTRALNYQFYAHVPPSEVHRPQ